MKNSFYLLLFSTCISFHVKSQDSLRFHQTIDTLCSEYFYGRGYHQEGHIKSSQFLFDAFQQADTTYLQHFNFDLNLFSNESLALGEDTLNTCYDYIPLPQALSTTVKRDCFKVIELDSTFFKSMKEQKRFLKQSINDHAVVYDSRFESHITDKRELQEKIYREAGIIIQLTDNDLLKSFSQSAWMPPAFSVKSEKYTRQKIVHTNLKQSVQKISSQNVIAVLEGTNPKLKELVICAHYDHVGGYGDCFIPGANDNASGVAMMLELFHYFRSNQPERTIKFIAFGAEEVGLLGSRYYVENSNLDEIEFVLNLDLIGAGSKGLTVVNGKIFTDFHKKLEAINNAKSYVSTIKIRGEAANSDHYYFSKNGVPAFFIYSNGTVGGYHNIKDQPKNLERGYFGGIFNLLKDFLKSI